MEVQKAVVLLSISGARAVRGAQIVILFTFLGLLGIAPSTSAAESGSHTVYLKLVLNAEGQLESTSGCFNVRERRYEDARWWSKEEVSESHDVEHRLRAVVAAFRNRDRASLLQLSDPASRDPKVFDKQAEAFFQQFSVLSIKEVPFSVEIDSLILFFVTFDYQGKTSSAPLAFRRTGENEVWFLPERSRSLDYLLVSDWFDNFSRNADNPDSYQCKPAEIARATHRVPISSDRVVGVEDRSYLYLTGSPIGEASTTEPSKKIESTLRTLKASLKAYDGASLLQSLEPVGAKRLKDWWATADAAERANYISAIVSQKPFFAFDLSPLIVLYSKSEDNVPRVMYFVSDQDGSLRWTNSSYGTTLDRIFKSGPFYDAAKSIRPFDTFGTNAPHSKFAVSH